MQNNQQVLVGVIIALVVVIGFLAYQNRRPETVGEKIGHTIDRATDNIDHAVDDATAPHRVH